PPIGKFLRQKPTVGDKTLASNGQPQVDGPDTNLQHVTRLGMIYIDRTIQGMIPAARVVDPFKDAIQLSRNLLFWHPELLKVAWVAGGGLEPHNIAGINREHRLEGGIEKATMDGVRCGFQVMHLRRALRHRLARQERMTHPDS